MELIEKTLRSERVFEGRILSVRVDTVLLPDGKESTREIVEHNGAVAVLAVDDEGFVYLVRQYRKPVGETLLEIPAGKLEPGEDPLDCARRELLEETGLVAQQWQRVFRYYSTPGFTSEVVHVYIAKDVEQRTAKPESDEFVEVVKMRVEEAYEKVRDGTIRDGKSIIAIQHLVLDACAESVAEEQGEGL